MGQRDMFILFWITRWSELLIKLATEWCRRVQVLDAAIPTSVFFFSLELTNSWYRYRILYCRQDVPQVDYKDKENIILLFSLYNRSHDTTSMVNLSIVKFHCSLIGNRRVLLLALFFMVITRKMLCEVVIKLSVEAIFSAQHDDK